MVANLLQHLDILLQGIHAFIFISICIILFKAGAMGLPQQLVDIIDQLLATDFCTKESNPSDWAVIKSYRTQIMLLAGITSERITEAIAIWEECLPLMEKLSDPWRKTRHNIEFYQMRRSQLTGKVIEYRYFLRSRM
jgi:hypothetical protein